MFMVHKSAMDVFIEVIRVQYSGHIYRDIQVNWWNLGFTGNPWLIDHNQTIRIFGGDLINWQLFDPLNDIHPGRA